MRLDTDETVPEVKKTVKTIPKKRQTGKLTKKEQRQMKKTHKDIGLLLAPPKPLEVKRHEDDLAKEVEAMEVLDEERVERLERVRRREI